MFNSRMSEEEAKEISRYIYEALDREEGQPVTLKELAHLSSINEEFDKRIYRLYTKEVKGH